MNKQVLLEGLQRALRDNDVRWPIGAKEEKLRRSTTSRCRGNEIKSGRINPMEILENQNQRAFCRQSLQSVTNLTYHALARGSQDLLLQSFSLFCFYQGRKLAQPGGSTLGQSLGDSTAVRIADQLSERLEHRVVGFFSSEALDALSPSDSQIWLEGGLLMKSVDESRFSDACLSGDKDELSLATQGAGETGAKLSKRGLPTDDSLWAEAWERGRTFVAHRSDKLVSPSGKGLNICRLFGIVAKSLADSANVLLYDFRINVRLGPDGLKNLILRDETFRVFHEITEYVKSLGSERYAFFRAPKAVVHGVEPEWLESLHCRTIAFR